MLEIFRVESQQVIHCHQGQGSRVMRTQTFTPADFPMVEEDENDAVVPHTILKSIAESNDDVQHQQIREQFRGTMDKLLQNLTESAVYDQAANADCKFKDCPCVERIDLVMKTYHDILNSALLSDIFLSVNCR